MNLKIQSLIYKLEFKFSFPVFATSIPFVMVTQEHAYITAGLSSSESTPCHHHSASEEAECRPGGREKLPADLESDMYV